jgi:uncharacterized protein (TIGR02996 family)
METMAALLEALARSPGDGLGWLALADCLEEAGDTDRAELVRLSAQLRTGLGPTTAEALLRALVAKGLTIPLPKRRLALGATWLDLVLVPPGTFWMGGPDDEERQDFDERPRHRVTLTRGFWLGTHQVTQAQWEAVMGGPAPRRFSGPGRPADGVSWDDGQRFLAKLGSGYRLPTEAEWEYACRGLTTTPFSFGPVATSGLANFDGNYPYGPAAVGPWLEATTPVGSYPPNAWGLYDMHGNVWEWCHDWYDEEYYSISPAVDPPGPEEGTMKVLRGGSWYSYSWSCRSAGRERFSPQSGAGNYGLRVAATAGGALPH